MSDYWVVRRVLEKEERRRAAYLRYRPTERGPAMAEIEGAKAALERLRKAAEWARVGKFWQDKFG